MNLFLPYALTRPFSLMMRQTRRRLTVTPDLSSDAFILREPYRPLLAACAAAAAVAPDIKVLEGRVVSGDQFVSPAEQKARILATFGDLCCEMEGCTIAQAAYLNGVPLVVVRAISDKPCAEGQVGGALGVAHHDVRALVDELADGIRLGGRVVEWVDAQ